MALKPAPEGSPAARFAAMLVHHMRVGTRPAGQRGTGAWSADTLGSDVGLSRRTIENYASGRSQPPDVSLIARAFFGSDPRRAVARNAFLIAFAEATGTEPPPWAFATSNIPIRVPTHFMGRDEPLALIHTALQRYEGRVAITALHGMRGVGKTVLAAAYADRHRAAYRATWWIRAQTVPTMRADLADLGVRLGWVAADSKEEPALAAVMEQLRLEGDGILLIYDNATDARGLAPYLPRGGAARIIVTSNTHAWRGVADPVEIRLWPQAIGADYLIARTGRAAEQADAEQLSKALGGLPLAHEMAAAYCEQLDVRLAEYSRRFAAAPSRMLDDDRRAPAEYHDGLTVAKTFALAIEQAVENINVGHPAAKLLITFAALLPPEPIPLFLFEEGRTRLGEPLATLLAGDGLEEAIGALRVFGLVGRETISDERQPVVTETFQLHRLVREVAAAGLVGENPDSMRRLLLFALAAVYPAHVFDNPQTWPRARRLDALALALVDGKGGIPEGAEEAATELLSHLASYRHGPLANYPQARALFERALAICETVLGPDHPDTATGLNNLAFLLQSQGVLAEARLLYERGLAIYERALGQAHPHTALSLHNLAGLLHAQGDLAGARLTYERALTICETVLGVDHPQTAASLQNLANVLHDQGDLSGTRQMFERALAVCEKAHGPDHPSTAISLNYLAHLLWDQGDLAEARRMFERALAIREVALGPDHPATATSLNNLALLLLEDEGDLTEVRRLFERALAIREVALGPDHPATATSLNNLGLLLLENEGDLTEARRLFERALVICEAALGPNHLDVAPKLHNLAATLQAQHDLAGARGLYQRALAICKTMLGPDHPSTAKALKGLAGVIHAQGDLDEAHLP